MLGGELVKMLQAVAGAVPRWESRDGARPRQIYVFCWAAIPVVTGKAAKRRRKSLALCKRFIENV